MLILNLIKSFMPTQADFWKTHPVFFSKFEFPGHELDRFLDIHPSFLGVPIQFLQNIGA